VKGRPRLKAPNRSSIPVTIHLHGGPQPTVPRRCGRARGGAAAFAIALPRFANEIQGVPADQDTGGGVRLFA